MEEPLVSQVRWSAEDYDALPLPHEEWGRRLVDSIALSGSETVVDIGAGTGRDAALLLQRLPHGRIICLDGSPQMRERCANRFAEDDRVTVDAVDLRGAWPVGDAAADVIMSVATLHWLTDHRPVFSEAARVLKPGGVLRVDAGGRGNIERVLQAVAAVGATDLLPSWNYADAGSTLEVLAAAGLDPAEVTLRESPAFFNDDETFRRYLHRLILHRADLETVDRVAALIPDRCVDYVRLEITAHRP